MLIFANRTYSLRKSRHVLKEGYNLFRKKSETLPPNVSESFRQLLIQLENGIAQKDRPAADAAARKVQNFKALHFKKSLFGHVLELVFALAFALVVATIVRQMWFELYEIPTGSMRPTFREQDHLTVSKLTFGVNVPLQTEHFYFNPELVQRASVLIFSGDGVPFIDENTSYFWLFPYKKRYIKRLIGKPGDTLYFYGGKIYGYDKEGNFINELVDSPWMQQLEHIPFLSFEGRVTAPSFDKIIFHHMNKPIGRLTVASGGISGEVFNGEKWIKDNPEALRNPHDTIQTYSDFWGMRNFAMARLVTKQQLLLNPEVNIRDLDEGVLYLELRHSPSLNYPKSRFHQDSRGFMVFLTPRTTVIPLKQEHLDAIMDHMYTARFVLKDGRVSRYSLENNQASSTQPRFGNVPDGTYEFYFGKAEKIGFAGVPSALPEDHPLYSREPANVQKLFNLGIELDNFFAADQPLRFPTRFAYFREGDLYLLGAPVLKKEDPTLIKFNENEKQRQERSSKDKPYIGFKDYGPPLLADKTVDKEFIKNFGFTIPEKNYLVLGDNHAMSSDSRVFGFVPENNIQGAPSLIIWPPGERVGAPVQKPYPIINLQRIIIWSLAALIGFIWYLVHRYNQRKAFLMVHKQNFSKSVN